MEDLNLKIADVQDIVELDKILGGLKAKNKFLEKHTKKVEADPKNFPKDELKNTKKRKIETEKEITDISNLKEKKFKESQEKWSSKRLIHEPVYYSHYLGLDQLLNCQKPLSAVSGNEAHDEMLFIIIHQTYELWFKQMLHEANAVINMMNKEYVEESNMSFILHSLQRVIEIMKILVNQFNVMETMTPLGFLDFRDFLFPASGFQSFQFRLFENRLGLKVENRVLHDSQSYHSKLSEEHQATVRESEKLPSLFEVIQKWLERTPFLSVKDEEVNYNFLSEYKKAAEKMFEEDKQVILKNTDLDPKGKERENELTKLEENHKSFLSMFDEESHNKQVETGARSLSFKAVQAALLIFVYQDEPMLQMPYRILQSLIDLDELLTSWRYRHALMVQRMIGTKLGTGGSSGYFYLKRTIERGRIFADFGNMSTFLIPRKDLPQLPTSIRSKLGFFRQSIPTDAASWNN